MEVRKGEDLVALLLARGWTRAKAAKSAHVSEGHVYELLQDPKFKRRIATARNEMFRAAVGRLAAMSVKAVDRLERLLESESEQVAIQAVREWRTGAIDLGAQFDLREVIEAYEGGYDQGHDRQPGQALGQDPEAGEG